MIPIRLEITNFLSYQETAELDFAGIQTACISGRNGAGKSSILDALTWVLFGKSRSKSDDEVVNKLAARDKGQAEVKLEFSLEGTLYRVMRRKRIRRSPVLELQIDSEAGWKPLTESKVRETQAAIENLLRMNYDTFVNASFLLQGKADEFTTKTPNQRKVILADLLGVSLWERYREKAVVQRREVEQDKLRKGDRLEQIMEELANRPEREAAHAAALERLTALTGQLDAQEALLSEARKTDAIMKEQQGQLSRLQGSLQQGVHKLSELEAQQSRRESERAAHQALLDNAGQIKADYAAWETAQTTAKAWQEKANKSHQLQNRRAPLRNRIASTQSRLEERRRFLSERAEQMAGQAGRIAEAVQAIAEATAQQNELQSQRDAISDREKAWLAAQGELQRLQHDRANATRQRDELRKRQSAITHQEQELAKVSIHLEQQLAALAQLEKSLATEEQGRRDLADFRHEVNRLEAEQPTLKEQMDEMKARMDQLRAETGQVCPLCGQPLTEAHLEKVLTDIQADGKQKGDLFRANRRRLQELTRLIGQREQDVAGLATLEKQIKQKQQDANEADLRQRELEREITAWQQSGAATLAALESQLADDAALERQEAAVADLADVGKQRDRLEREMRQAQSRLAQQESRLNQLQVELERWQEQEEGELAATVAQLEAEAFAQEERAAIEVIDAELAALGYDGKAHQDANEALEKLATAPKRHQALAQAETEVRHLDESIRSLINRVAEAEEQQKQWTSEIAHLEQSLAALNADGVVDLNKLQDDVHSLREQHQKARSDIAVEESKLATLKQQEAKHKVLLDELAELDHRIQQIRELELAFGRNGVQALLIEQAMPDLESRANTLLERLSDGEMTITFQTQRKLKSRDELAETLDITINDTAGERPYENYSGGEQFRVNFAIRLALSQLLAQRSGARLQTLVIDEGFGSQDPAGRQRLVEAINTIQGDFERILIITHIDELKDAFPTHIEVEKTLNGSTISVI